MEMGIRIALLGMDGKPAYCVFRVSNNDAADRPTGP